MKMKIKMVMILPILIVLGCGGVLISMMFNAEVVTSNKGIFFAIFVVFGYFAFMDSSRDNDIKEIQEKLDKLIKQNKIKK